MKAPQNSGPFKPDNWHFPGIALKGDDALTIANLLDMQAVSIRMLHDTEDKKEQFDRITLLKRIRELSTMLKSCKVVAE